MICKYVNEIRGGDAEAKRLKAIEEYKLWVAREQEKADAVEIYETVSQTSSGKRERFSSEASSASEDEEEDPEPPSPDPVEITDNSPSCAMLTNQAFNRSTRTAGSRRAKEEFNKIGMTVEKFENLDFFFVLYVDREWADSTDFRASKLSQARKCFPVTLDRLRSSDSIG